MYAVVETGGKQYKVAAGDKLEIERLPVEAGQVVTFDKVLLVNSDAGVKVGAPTLENTTVSANLLEHKRGVKLVAFKFKRRQGYHKKKGHRQELSVVEITEIKAA